MRVFAKKIVKNSEFDIEKSGIYSKYGDSIEACGKILEEIEESVVLGNPMVTWKKILNFFEKVNLLINDHEPWKMKNGGDKGEFLTTVFHLFVPTVKYIGLFFPKTKNDFEQIFKGLNNSKSWEESYKNNQKLLSERDLTDLPLKNLKRPRI